MSRSHCCGQERWASDGGCEALAICSMKQVPACAPGLARPGPAKRLNFWAPTDITRIRQTASTTSLTQPCAPIATLRLGGGAGRKCAGRPPTLPKQRRTIRAVLARFARHLAHERQRDAEVLGHLCRLHSGPKRSPDRLALGLVRHGCLRHRSPRRFGVLRLQARQASLARDAHSFGEPRRPPCIDLRPLERSPCAARLRPAASCCCSPQRAPPWRRQPVHLLEPGPSRHVRSEPRSEAGPQRRASAGDAWTGSERAREVAEGQADRLWPTRHGQVAGAPPRPRRELGRRPRSCRSQAGRRRRSAGSTAPSLSRHTEESISSRSSSS